MSAQSDRKHIVIVHGYLVSGTGSNIYNYNVALEWKKQGHAVTVVCQDRQAGSYLWVDEYYGPNDVIPKSNPGYGRIRVVVPDIGDLLPVYVYDVYDGFPRVKTIPNCSEEEIEQHIERTVDAIRKAVSGGCHKVLANHALLSPVNASRALAGTNIPFDIKIHCSAITFVIKPNPEYIKYAVEAMNSCNKIIAGSKHVYNLVVNVFGAHVDNLKSKLVIIPPGLDPELFVITNSFDNNVKVFLDEVDKTVAADGSGRKASELPKIDGDLLVASPSIHEDLVRRGALYNQRVVDSDLSTRFPTLLPEEPLLIFFGKFLNTKGVGELILAFPSMAERWPTLRLVLVGFGGYREHIEVLLDAMVTGDVALFKAVGHCRDPEGISFLDSSLDIESHFKPIDDRVRSRILVTGCLNHAQLCRLLPLASVSTTVSKFSEGFAMVNVEAMAAGVLPLSVDHSGLSELLSVVDGLEPLLGRVMRVSTRPGGDYGLVDPDQLVDSLPDKLADALTYLYPNGNFADSSTRDVIGARLRDIAVNYCSWNSICDKLIKL